MKFIHSYKPVFNENKIEKKVVLQMALSALLAHKHYGNIHLYADDETARIVKDLNLPYSTIDTSLFHNYTGKAFAVPKMIVYSMEENPFIHIDIDTFMFKKINFNMKTKIYYAFTEGLINGELKFSKEHGHFSNTYLRDSFDIIDNIDEKFKLHINYNDIYNMCVFGGWQYDLINVASKYCLKIYEENQEFIDSRFTRNALLEQMLLPNAIKMFAYNWGRDAKVKTLFKNSFFNTFEGCENAKFNYPVTIRNGKKVTKFNNQEELFNNTDIDYDGFLHLNGYKDVKEMKFLNIVMLYENFKEGREIHERVINMYGKDEIDHMFYEFLKYKKR